MLFVVIHSANIQDRDGALRTIRRRFPWRRHVFADGGHAGPKLRAAFRGRGDRIIEIIKRSGAVRGFEALPRLRAVEQAFAWRWRRRRLARDRETSFESFEGATAWTFIASIRPMTRRLARYCCVT